MDLPKLSGVIPMTALPHQERLSDKLMDPETQGQVAVHGLGSGKCQLPGTMIITENGVHPIEELFPATPLTGDEEALPGVGAVWAGTTLRQVRARYRQNIDEDVVAITTARGAVVRCTQAHPLRVVREGGLAWAPAASVSVGDWVACVPAIGAGVATLSPMLELGLWQATEGHTVPATNAAVITQDDMSVLLRLQQIFRAATGLTGTITEPTERAAYIRVGGAVYRQALADIGFQWGALSAVRRLPSAVFSLSRLDTCRALAVIFDAEGSGSRVNAELSSASPVMIEQIQALLLRIGVRSARHSMRKCATNGKRIYRTYYRVSISGDDYRVFAAAVSPWSRKMCWTPSAVSNPNFGVPWGHAYRRLKAMNLLGYVKGFGVPLNRGVSLSPATTLRLVVALRTPPPSPANRGGTAGKWQRRTHAAYAANQQELLGCATALEAMLTSGMRFEPVETVEVSRYTGTVYDLEVDAATYDDKWYTTAAGVVVHNTFSSIHAARKANLPILAIVPAALRNNYRKEIARSGFSLPSEVVSYQEALKRKDDPAFREMSARSMLVMDEAHRTGQSTSQRSLLPTDLPAKKKLMLTATPIRNSPEELIPLVNAAKPGALPDTPEEFRKQYLRTRNVPVGLWGRMTGVKPAKEQVPINLDQFRKAVSGSVDFYNSVDRTAYPSHSEEIVEVPMSDKQHAAYNFTMGKYPHLAYKIRHGLPVDKSEEQDFQAFMNGPRQVSNHPGPFHKGATDEDANKIKVMADEIEKRYKKDRNYRGVSYSSFLDTGVTPLSRELTRRGIPHGTFTGEADDNTRKQVIDAYHHGRLPHLLISGAGSEGLDLKGTKLMQVMEPHWQEEQINQVRGRAIRYHSHSHLPEAERHVEVQRFHSIPHPAWWEKMIGRKKPGQMGADEYIYNKARTKQTLNQPFLDILREEGSKTAVFDLTTLMGPLRQNTEPAPLGRERRLLGTVQHAAGPQTVYEVDGGFIRDPKNGFENGIAFVGGSNSAADSFVPPGEIWVERQASFIDEIAIVYHELSELSLMAVHGLSYEQAHEIAQSLETSARAANSGETFWPVDMGLKTPGLLVDLDGTLVTTDGWPDAVHNQRALPRRHEVLARFKQEGYKIIGITNRSVTPPCPTEWGLDEIQALNAEALQIFEGLLDDVLYLPFGPSDHHKPSPFMIQVAMDEFNLDPSNCLFVGDLPCDAGAAAAAGIPFATAHEFFHASGHA